MKKLLFTIVSLFLVSIIIAQNVTYTSSSENFANPERGWYKYSKAESTNAFSFLSQSSLTNMRVNDKITLILRIYDLGAFKTVAISQTFLDNIKTDFNTLRASGVKCVLRFRYSESNDVDATKPILLSHIEQLKSITISNQDVIACVEAGFIGKYGEWYYTSNYGNNGVISAQQLADRREIGLKIMELAPTRLTLFRTPIFQQLVGGIVPIPINTAYNGTVNSRIGLHNDAFLSSSSDSGTFSNTTSEYTYLDAQSKYTFCGGESNALYPTKQNCSPAIATMTRFHYNYLNFGYHPDVIALWKSQGCYDEIQRRLGYRFELLDSNLSNGFLTIRLKNTGFSNVFNAKQVFLVLKNQINTDEYFFRLSTDIRFWNAGETITISEDVRYSLPNGKYDAYLFIPDNDNKKPEYAIQMANSGIWNATKGYNDLLQTLTISNLSVQIFFSSANIISVSGASKYTLKVYNMQGRLVSTSFDLSNLKTGFYIIKVNVNGTIYTEKVYKP